MNSSIFIPKTINVGYQNREGTYTGKLAYVIYTDEKGKLRKENSWNSWRDKTIEPSVFDNIPTEGFVLNKKVGDYDSGWNHRHAYCRIYDPRGFEFEITFENLLYILENTNSIVGKGLEGLFVKSQCKDPGMAGYEVVVNKQLLRDAHDVIKQFQAMKPDLEVTNEGYKLTHKC